MDQPRDHHREDGARRAWRSSAAAWSGVEMAQAWRTLGSQVTLIEAADRLIAREEPFASEQVAESLRELGVDVRLGQKATAVSRADGEVDGRARGRARRWWPTSCSWRSGAARTRTTSGSSRSGSSRARASRWTTRCGAAGGDWLYAIGDVNGRTLLTHMGKYQARDRRRRDPGQGREGAPPTAPVSPRVIFTDPQVAAVGHTLQSAQDAGIDARAVDVRDLRQRRRQLLRQGRAGHHAAGRGRGQGRDRGRHDHRAPRSPTSCTRPRSPWWGRCRSSAWPTRCPSFPTRSEVWLNLLEELGL